MKPPTCPPPGLTPPADEGRTGLKATESRTLEKVRHLPGRDKHFMNDTTSTLNKHQNTFSIQIIENEDLSGHSDDEGSKAAEVFDAVSGSSSSNSSSLAGRLALMGRRGSLQGPEAPKAFVQGRRHSTGQVLTFR